MTRIAAALLLALAAGLLAACTHDLDALQKNLGASGGTGGSGDQDGSVALRDTGVADAGGDAGELDTCAPCDPPEPLGSGSITPTSCCTGRNGSECGLRFPSGVRCHAREAPGMAGAGCPDITRDGTTFPGCCRVEGQCGITIGGFGCVARTDVPALLGGPLSPRACVVPCAGDATCQAFSGDFVCVEDASHEASARGCARSCQRDKDCAPVEGTVCAIQNNLTDNRVDAFCRKPFGPGEQDDTCQQADDCAHGTCVSDNRATPPRLFCTQLCAVDLDCPGSDDTCIDSSIPVPDGTDTQPFSICWNR